MSKVYNEILQTLGKDKVLYNELMKNHTSFNIGGPVDILLLPENDSDIQNIVNICSDNNEKFMVIGNGTNLLVSDKGIRGIVLKLYKNYSDVSVVGDKIIAKAGILLSELASAAYENSLSGMEFASGIPGTLGGAVAMNAGAYDGEMKDIITETRYIEKNGLIKELKGEEHQFGYRSSKIQKDKGIVLESTVSLSKGNKTDIKSKMDDLNSRRSDKQPLEMPSAGSVFKRPPGYYAGKLIQDSGLRGFSIGGASVSQKHCGFIVNNGNATASEVLELVRHIQKTVKMNFGVTLETEIRLTGEE